MVRLSVIMPVYNGEEYLAEAIESILNQTFRDFELIIANDASRDNSLSVIEKYARTDSRIVVLNHQVNEGLTATLNHMIRISGGELIARMDQDDIAFTDRLEKQVGVFDQHNADVVFGHIKFIDYAGSFVCDAWFPELSKTLKYLHRINFIPHPTVMLKKTVFTRFGSYNPESRLEDADLWIRLRNKVKFLYIPESILYYRINPGSAQNFVKNKNDLNQYYYHLANICLYNNKKSQAIKYMDKLNIPNKIKLSLKLLLPFQILFRLRLLRGDHYLKPV